MPQLRAYEVPESWRQPVAPLRLTRDAWQVGTAGLGALLLVGDAGAILIDGGMPQAADHILDNLRALSTTQPTLRLLAHPVEAPFRLFQDRLRAWMNHHPEAYYIPAGGSSALGALGYGYLRRGKGNASEA